MDSLLQDLGLQTPDMVQLARISIRLLLACLLGAVVGIERERRHYRAGLRTHMLVALGAALFVVVPMEAGGTTTDLTNVTRGVAAGVGFLGAGVILKRIKKGEVRGLTTAASIWVTAGMGLAAGAGWFSPAIIGLLLAWIVLAVLRLFEKTASQELTGSEEGNSGNH